MSAPTPHHAPPPDGALVIRFCAGLGLALLGALVAAAGMFAVGFGAAMMAGAALDLHHQHRQHRPPRRRHH